MGWGREREKNGWDSDGGEKCKREGIGERKGGTPRTCFSLLPLGICLAGALMGTSRVLEGRLFCRAMRPEEHILVGT